MFWQRGHYFVTRGHYFVTVSEISVVIISSRFSVSVILTSVRHFWRVGTGCCHFSDKGIVTVTVGRQPWPNVRQNWPFDDLSSQIDIAVILTRYGRYWRVRTGWCHFWRIWAVSDSHMVTNDSHIVRTDVSVVIDVPAVIQRPRISSDVEWQDLRQLRKSVICTLQEARWQFKAQTLQIHGKCEECSAEPTTVRLLFVCWYTAVF